MADDRGILGRHVRHLDVSQVVHPHHWRHWICDLGHCRARHSVLVRFQGPRDLKKRQRGQDLGPIRLATSHPYRAVEEQPGRAAVQ